MVYFFDRDGLKYELDPAIQGMRALSTIVHEFGGLSGKVIFGLVLERACFVASFVDVRFVECVFDDCTLDNVFFEGAVFENCTFKGLNDWVKRPGISLINTTQEYISNEAIAKRLRAKVFSLPNKDFVKVCETCDFCHKDTIKIMRRAQTVSSLRPVPNCDKKVCNRCYDLYDLYHKEANNRTYGYRGAVKKHTTPMDKTNTVLVGLEMEFEGSFSGWKELEDAHQGRLHYGYDSSVRGENELSWDCGSYSWWKYLAPLKSVCDALKKYGGETGDTAGIHIHVSKPDVNVLDVTVRLNRLCQANVFNTLMRAVSMRTNKERFERYANLSVRPEDHHAGISYNRKGTCEFRVFASSLDHREILSRIKFCKEIFTLVAENTPHDIILCSLSKETKRFITNCAVAQEQNKMITKAELKGLIKELNKEVKKCA